MSTMFDGLIKAFELIISLDPEVYGTMFLSLRVSGSAVMFAAILGIASY